MAYTSALAVAVAVVFRLSSDLGPFVLLALAHGAATLVVFVFSVAFDNSSFYDPYWSVSPPAIVAFWALSPAAAGADPIRTAFVGAVVSLWAVRLTYNWFRGWSGVGQEDWRYAEMRPKAGRMYWVVSLFGFHLFPSVLVFVGCLPLAAALTSGEPLGAMGLVGVGVAVAAVGLEAVADQQLHRFRAGRPESADTLESGLWRYSRHPNYFGEWLFWVGLFLIGFDADPQAWWTVVGPGMMLALFVFVSIPLLEARMLRRRAAYAERVRRVSSFLPWPPANG